MTTSDLPSIDTSAISPASAYSTLMHHRTARSGSAVSSTSTASTASSASLATSTDSRSACSSAFPSYDDLFYSPSTPSTAVSSPSSTRSSPSAKARVCRSYETLTTRSNETITTGTVRLPAVRDYEADLRALMEEMKDYYEDHAGTTGELNEKAMDEINGKPLPPPPPPMHPMLSEIDIDREENTYTYTTQPLPEDAELGFAPVFPLSPRGSSLSYLRSRSRTFSHPARSPSPSAALVPKSSVDLDIRVNSNTATTVTTLRPTKSTRSLTSQTPTRPRRRPSPLLLEDSTARAMGMASLKAAAEIEDQVLSQYVPTSPITNTDKYERAHPHRSPPRAGVPQSPITPLSIRFDDVVAPLPNTHVHVHARSPLAGPSYVATRPAPRPLLAARSEGNLHLHVAPRARHHHSYARSVAQGISSSNSGTQLQQDENSARRSNKVNGAPFLQPSFNKSFSAPSTPTGTNFLQYTPEPTFRDFPKPPSHNPSLNTDSATIAYPSLLGRGLAPPNASLSKWSLSTAPDDGDVAADFSSALPSLGVLAEHVRSRSRSRANSVVAPPSVMSKNKEGKTKVGKIARALARLVGGKRRKGESQSAPAAMNVGIAA